MHSFLVKIRTATARYSYAAIAQTAALAFEAAAAAQGDTPCGITVTPAGAQ